MDISDLLMIEEVARLTAELADAKMERHNIWVERERAEKEVKRLTAQLAAEKQRADANFDRYLKQRGRADGLQSDLEELQNCMWYERKLSSDATKRADAADLANTNHGSELLAVVEAAENAMGRVTAEMLDSHEYGFLRGLKDAVDGWRGRK
jgi:hypothetical protein